jgi:hypothetical protein
METLFVPLTLVAALSPSSSSESGTNKNTVEDSSTTRRLVYD